MLGDGEERRLPAPRDREKARERERLALQTVAETRLHASWYRELHFVSCELNDGVLMLRGRVSTFFMKQIAQTLIGELDGVGMIDNRLEVVEGLDSDP